MPLIIRPALPAAPAILVRDLIAMLRRHFYAPVAKRFRGLRSPAFKRRAVRVVLDVADHKVREVAVFVGEGVEETGAVVDDFGGEFDGGVMADLSFGDVGGRVRGGGVGGCEVDGAGIGTGIDAAAV
jgi:hypothetical protein